MAGWLDRLKDMAQQGAEAVRSAVQRESAALVIGQVAGKTVCDEEGGIIVEAGMRITPEMAERAQECGLVHLLVGAAAAAGVQDLRERVDLARRSTPEGFEDSSLESVDDYAEARRYVGRIAVIDVTDVRGAVVVPGGSHVTEDHVRSARSHGLLRALIYSASQAQPEAPRTRSSSPAPAKPTSDAPDPTERRRLPLVEAPPTEGDRPPE